jgi:serine/threonine protein kinase
MTREQKSNRPSPSDSLASFCPVCGLEATAGGSAAITGVFSSHSACQCRAEDFLSGDGMAERFMKLKEAEANRVFASVTKNVVAGRENLPEAINLMPGAVIGKIYKIITLLGKGGMGEVYLANNLSLAKVCALKVIPPAQVTDTSWKRFQNEARAIAGLEHVNLVKVTDLGLHEGCLPFYAMEYVEGETLTDRLSDREPIALNVALDIFLQLCDGLDYAHRRGVVHRDLKPGNIMLTKRQGDKCLVKILDFGLVKLTRTDKNHQGLTRVGEVFGTPYYMSPEQCLGARIDGRSDIYSIGCVLFETLTGEVPFMGENAVDTIMLHQTEAPPTLTSVLGSGVSQSLENVIARILKKNPNERYQTMAELKLDLEKVARGEEVKAITRPAAVALTADRAHEESRIKEPEGRRFSWEILAAGGLLAMLLAVFCWLQFPSTKAPSRAVRPVSSQPAAAPAIESPVSAGESKPFATVAGENGVLVRTFYFPTDTLIGSIQEPGGPQIKASGKVSFKASSRLIFLPNAFACRFLDYFKRFRQGDVDTIVLPELDLRDATVTAEDCLLAVLEVPGLRALDLSRLGPLSDRAIATLDRFSALKSLTLKGHFDAVAMAKLGVLKNLEELNIYGYHDVSAVLKVLRCSPHLRKLYLPESPVDLEGIEAIATMANLKDLQLARLIPNTPASRAEALKIFGSRHFFGENPR